MEQTPFTPEKQSPPAEPPAEQAAEQANLRPPFQPGEAATETPQLVQFSVKRKLSTDVPFVPPSNKKQSSDVRKMEAELKHLAVQYADTPLYECANVAKSSERRTLYQAGKVSNAEKQSLHLEKERDRQVFCLVWLTKNCQLSEKSIIPRGRVYAAYAASCADFGLKPMAQASLGKMIRIMYPEIVTRRLGTRGQSRYHYCGVKLVNDDTAISTPENTSKTMTPSGSPSNTTVEATSPVKLMEYKTDGLRFLEDFLEQSCKSEVVFPMTFRELELHNPDLDADSIVTFSSMYKVYANSIFESFRYMQVAKVPLLMNQFTGNMSKGAQQVYYSDDAASWVDEADIKIYQGVLRMLTRLIFEHEDLPELVLLSLKEVVSEEFQDAIARAIANLPVKLQSLKLKNIGSFIKLVKRLLRVIGAGYNAYKVLHDDTTRTAMIKEWHSLQGVVPLLYEELPFAKDIVADGLCNRMVNEISAITASGSLQSLADLFSTLAYRVCHAAPAVPEKFIIMTVDTAFTAVMKQITEQGGHTFAEWWVLKLWVDEWLRLTGELGWFLKLYDSTGTNEFLKLLTADTSLPRPDDLSTEALLEMK